MTDAPLLYEMASKISSTSLGCPTGTYCTEYTFMQKRIVCEGGQAGKQSLSCTLNTTLQFQGRICLIQLRGYIGVTTWMLLRVKKAQFEIHSKFLTSMGWLFFRASNSRARVKSVEANCVQISYSGKQWSTHRYSIHEANPSFSHKCVHHSCKYIITVELYDQSKNTKQQVY